MKPLEVWTCQRAENLKKKSSKIPKITTQQQWYLRRADKLSAEAARRSTTVGGGAHKLSAARPAHGSTQWRNQEFKLGGAQPFGSRPTPPFVSSSLHSRPSSCIRCSPTALDITYPLPLKAGGPGSSPEFFL